MKNQELNCRQIQMLSPPYVFPSFPCSFWKNEWLLFQLLLNLLLLLLLLFALDFPAQIFPRLDEPILENPILVRIAKYQQNLHRSFHQSFQQINERWTAFKRSAGMRSHRSFLCYRGLGDSQQARTHASPPRRECVGFVFCIYKDIACWYQYVLLNKQFRSIC